MKQSSLAAIRWLRRISQALFLLLFLHLLFLASYSGRSLDLSAGTVEAVTAVNGFFRFDPFVAAAHLVCARVLPAVFLLSLITVGATLIFGRFFCGWVCPFGTLHHLAGSLRARREKGGQRRLEPWLRLKYLILVFLLVTGALSSLQPALLDPLCLLARSFTLSVFPAMHLVAKKVLIRGADSAIPLLGPSADRVYAFLETREIIGAHIAYRSALLTGSVFAALLLANLWHARFWCRFLCPLGALLALLSRFSPLRMSRNVPRCTLCGACMVPCQGGSIYAEPEGAAGGGIKWRQSECMLCFNCTAACPEDVIGFDFLGIGDPSERGPDLTRRSLLLSLIAGAAAAPFFRISGRNVNRSMLIRPPGAQPEDELLRTCVRCGTCSRICPTGAIHPSIAEAGIEGLWTPRLIPRIGYCVYSCTLCGQVCPSGAISRLSQEQKTGSERMRPMKIGTAVVNRERCIAWAKGTSCLACEEVCPVSPKAIEIEERGEAEGRIGCPVVDSLKCVGCGRCEYVCPVEGAAAIRVYSIGESRADCNGGHVV